MTRAEHLAQRNRVTASLAVDTARETHHDVYPVRGRETGRETGQTRESMRGPHAVRKMRHA